MASAFSHAVAALSLGTCFYRPQTLKRVWIAGAVFAVIPDLDAIGFRFGIHYDDFWGHRGFTHSLFFAALLAGVAAATLSRGEKVGIGRNALFAYFFLATASHGLLDAMTNGGLGIALFSPFNTSRYFLPWRPIRVSPIAVHIFFSARGYEVLRSELLWIWLPAILLSGLLFVWRRMRRADFPAASN
ncbi:MAG TPA: metal-dependent hydrolase [Terriglobales bacterium]|nr:metal-dependent hydrolase [Terriglobales bacterium]